ncbi:MAG TPA: glycosyltransferase family 1 protein [Pirellulales bacterium]|jgi:glycosyltransferase involved in cell wall biosynthesis|nr:glycosyltransferase family 1 protein [Pirellulales bacterium]
MKILIVTDAWPPVTSGVVRTYQTTIRHLKMMGHGVDVITPDQFVTVRCPTDNQQRLALYAGRKTGRLIDAAQPDAIHVATEGPLGLAARNWCVKHSVPFTTSYTTKLPEYFRARGKIPTPWTYAVMRWFHRPAAGVMVSTSTLENELVQRGFQNLIRWGRGVDLKLFRPQPKDFLSAPRPVLMYVGRVAVEKNLEKFLRLDMPGTKYVVGDGPQLKHLSRKYRDARFVGDMQGEELARYYAAADVFVFPSRTDTFGLVLLEALASGVPVAAYPVPGPLDVVGNSGVGVLDEDLGAAVRKALQISPAECRRYAQRFGWPAVTQQFLGNLRPIREVSRRLAA